MTIADYVYDTATVPPFADLVPDASGDYTLTVWIDFDRQDDRHGGDGLFAPDNLAPFIGSYCVEAGRDDGAWRLRVSRWRGHDEDGALKDPPLVDLRDQTTGTDPLRALWLLLSGGSA
jgi:hypothetical protein